MSISKAFTKQYKVFRLKTSRKLRRHPFVLPVAGFLIMFFLVSAVLIDLNAQTIGAADSRVVNLFVDGHQQTIPTRAATVGELLDRLGIELREYDVVEPGLSTEILDDDFKVNVYRARPVTIIDEGKKITTLSAGENPEAVAEKVGVPLHPEDKVDIEISENILKDGIVGKKIVIDRATPANINLYGNQVAVRTHAATVGETLKEKDIKTLEGDTIQPAPETPLAPNTQIFVVRHGKQIETKEESIPVPIETVEDGTVASGTTIVKEEGTAGRKLVTYEIELRNDKEAARRVIQEVIAAQPTKKVIVKGTKLVYSNPSANVELGKKIAEEMGVGSQFHCLYNLFERESHWNHLARNRNTGAYGIPQALPGSKMGPGWEHDPAVQIRWGINYVKKYGGPCGAWNFWQLHHWY